MSEAERVANKFPPPDRGDFALFAGLLLGALVVELVWRSTDWWVLAGIVVLSGLKYWRNAHLRRLARDFDQKTGTDIH